MLVGMAVDGLSIAQMSAHRLGEPWERGEGVAGNTVPGIAHG